LSAASVETVRLPPRSPNLNAYAERLVGTIKEWCLDQLILIGEGSLRNAIHEFVQHLLDTTRSGENARRQRIRVTLPDVWDPI